jgi:primosomal protein N' (replication factor Y)
LLKERQQTQLPPFSHQAMICANAKNKAQAEAFLNEVAQLLRSIDLSTVEIWGPVPGVIEKKADYFYFNLYLQSVERQALHRMLNTMYKHIDGIKASGSVRWFLDVDPIE